MNTEEIKELLKKHNIFPNKFLDQHFLIDEEILKREVGYAEVSKEDTVLEIGPGIGTLTRLLSKAAKKVIVIEKDQKFGQILKKIPNTEVIIADALEVDWPPADKILSNVPYSISSPLVFKILDTSIKLAVLCLQKEFAVRMAARPGTKDYSRLSVNCALRADVKLLEDVPKEKYYPVPEVNSTIVKLIPKEFNPPEKFDSIVRALFQHKNKKVRNALLDSYHEIGSKEEVEKLIKGLGEISQERVIDLEPGEIVKIARTI